MLVMFAYAVRAFRPLRPGARLSPRSVPHAALVGSSITSNIAKIREAHGINPADLALSPSVPACGGKRYLHSPLFISSHPLLPARKISVHTRPIGQLKPRGKTCAP